MCTPANKAKTHTERQIKRVRLLVTLNVSDFAREWPKGGMIDHVKKAFDCARDLMSDSP